MKKVLKTFLAFMGTIVIVGGLTWFVGIIEATM